MALIISFMVNDYFISSEFPKTNKRDDPQNDDVLFNQDATKGPGTRRFQDFNKAHNRVDLPNTHVFKQQIGIPKEFLMTAIPSEKQANNIDFHLSIGELFNMVAYGQFIIEKSNMQNRKHDLLDQLFDFMVKDFSKYAFQIYSKTDRTENQMVLCMKMLKKTCYEGGKISLNRAVSCLYNERKLRDESLINYRRQTCISLKSRTIWLN